jgi:hypothetical protein
MIEAEQIEEGKKADAELEAILQEEQRQTGVSMTEYIKEKYKDSNSNYLFTEIIGPINGQILFQYNQSTKNQTESLLDVIHNELASTMTESEILEAFEDPDGIKALMHETQRWKPHDLPLFVESALTTNSTETTKHMRAIKRRYKPSTFCITENEEIDKEKDETNKNKTSNQTTLVDIPVHIRTPDQPPAQKQYATALTTTTHKDSNSLPDNKITETEIISSNQPNLMREITSICTKMIQQSNDELRKEIKEVRSESERSAKDMQQSIQTIKKDTKEDLQAIKSLNKETKESIASSNKQMREMMLMMKQMAKERNQNNQQTKSDTNTHQNDRHQTNNPKLQNANILGNAKGYDKENNQTPPIRTATPIRYSESCDEIKPSAATRQ